MNFIMVLRKIMLVFLNLCIVTKSFIYEIGEDFYEIMYKHKEVFD